jgi:predicted component of type VI protein secretion system
VSAKLKVEWGERVAALEVAPGQTVTVGSGERASFQIADASVADRQLALTYEGGGLQVVDLGGPARVLLGGRAIPLRDPTPLSVGDRIQLGPCLLVVEVAGAALGFPQQLEHDYELGRQLGEGGVGTVFAARPSRKNRWDVGEPGG